MNRFQLFTILFLVCFLIANFSILAQKEGKKVEREISIKKEEFPERALKIASPILKKAKKTKYYKEISEVSDYFEFKSDYKGEKISVKFNDKGELIDIEILKELTDFPDEIRQAITQYFENTFKKYRLTRIQIQYNREVEYEDGVVEEDDDEEYIEDFLEMDLDDLIIKYEIEAEVISKENDPGFFEFLFNDEGDLEMKRIIVRRADDNVLY